MESASSSSSQQNDRLKIDEIKALLNEGGDDVWHLSEHFPSRTFYWEKRGRPELNNKVAEKLIRVLVRMLSLHLKDDANCLLIQFLVPDRIGDRLILRASEQPFSVGEYFPLNRRFWRFIKHCMRYVYWVDKGGVYDEQVGPIGRVFRSGLPESSPDLQYYSSKEHPLCDEAVSCGFKGYVAVPFLHPLGGGHFCVLELFSRRTSMNSYIGAANRSLSAEGLLLTPTFKGSPYIHYQRVSNEVKELFMSAMNAEPRLHLVQVSSPSFEWDNASNNLIYMKRKAFATANEVEMNKCNNDDNMMQEFIYASEAHSVQSNSLGIARLLLLSPNSPPLICRNLSYLSRSMYPLAHYARFARLSFYFAICLLNTKGRNRPYIFEFFLHLKTEEEEENPSSILKLLLQLMEIKLKTFKTVSGRTLRAETVAEFSTESNTLIPFEMDTSTISYPIRETTRYVHEMEFNMIWKMMDLKTNVSPFAVENFLKETKMTMEIPIKTSLVFSSTENERVSKYPSNGNSLCLPNCLIQEKIKFLLKNMTSNLVWLSNCLVQFWAPKNFANKLCLVTSDQTFALGYPLKELFEFRKRCVDHRYFVNDGATVEELGPPGRVFRNSCPEYTPNLHLYSSKEFPLRDCAVYFGLRRYLALPLFYCNDDPYEQCVGVLEFVGCSQLTSSPQMLKTIVGMTKSFKDTNLKLGHFNFSEKSAPDVRSALFEVSRMRDLIWDIPQLINVEIWVPCNNCNDKNCIAPADYFGILKDSERKNKGKGIVGILLASKGKACFCANLCNFSIIEEPSVHVKHRQRLTVCFAICLHSSYTGSMPYVIQFFLHQSCKKGENLLLFLSSLFPKMKESLKTFKVASGREIGEELVIEIITFGTTSELNSFCQYEPDELPVRFKIIHCRQKSDLEWRKYQTTCDVFDDVQSGTNVIEGEQNITTGMNWISVRDVSEDEQNNTTCMDSNFRRDAIEGEQNDTTFVDLDEEVAIVPMKYERKGDKKLFNITREQLQLHFGKPLAEVAKELGVSKSTLKRAKERLGINRWPSHPQNKKNPSLFKALTPIDHVGASKRQRVVDNRDNNSTLPNEALHQQPTWNANAGEGNQNVVELTSDAFVTIKATFGEDIVKFKLDICSKMEKLNQEMASRLDIEVKSFKLKYLDEDGDWILLKCDQDLDFCINGLKELGKTYVNILVQSICK